MGSQKINLLSAAIEKKKIKKNLLLQRKAEEVE